MFNTALLIVGRDSSACIATRYGLEVRESNPGCGEIFPTQPDRPSGPPNLLYNGHRVFRGVQWRGRGVHHPPPSSAGVKNTVELYIYSPFGLSWSVLGWPLPLPLRCFIMRQSGEIHQVNCIMGNSFSVSFISEYSDILPDCVTIKYGNTED